jgi:hypothetical protein
MQNPAQQLEKQRKSSREALPLALPAVELQHLWFRVEAIRARGSLALVPAEEDVSTLAMAQGLAQVARDRPNNLVLLVNASLRACLPARGPIGEPEMVIADLCAAAETVAPSLDYIDFGQLHAESGERALALAPQLLDYMLAEGKRYTHSIFAVDSVLYQTRGIPLVRALDAAAVCLSLGRTSFASARQLIELLGRDKVVGAIAC